MPADSSIRLSCSFVGNKALEPSEPQGLVTWCRCPLFSIPARLSAVRHAPAWCLGWEPFKSERGGARRVAQWVGGAVRGGTGDPGLGAFSSRPTLTLSGVRAHSWKLIPKKMCMPLPLGESLHTPAWRLRARSRASPPPNMPTRTWHGVSAERKGKAFSQKRNLSTSLSPSRGKQN